jgi:methylated-DNA-protein-cysteine methyltransferase related protein
MNSTFFKRVYDITKRIPKGKVATYRQVAMLAGSPKAYRAVGMALKCNPDIKNIPCHRVIGSDGYMHGYSLNNGINSKIELLKSEGIEVINNRVDLKRYIWTF